MIAVSVNNKRGGFASAPFYARTIEKVIIADAQVQDGTSIALLSADGETLAMALIAGNEASLNLDTIQADARTAYIDADKTIPAVLAVGDSDNLVAVIPVQLGRNRLAEVAPPTESAPTYPTSAELQTILSTMQAQAARSEAAANSAESARDTAVEYVDVTLPQKAQEFESALTDSAAGLAQGLEDVATAKAGEIAEQAEAVNKSLDSKITEANSALDEKVAEANTSIDGKVEQAETAKTQAESARDGAVEAKEQAEQSAENTAEAVRGELQGLVDSANTFATSAASSAESASASATKASTSADDAKASAESASATAEGLADGLATLEAMDGRVGTLEASQAVQDKALETVQDKRINTADDSDYPLIVMVDKDVYKFIAPKGATNTSGCRYCCDGVAHYFGFLNATTDGDLYEYDGNLRFVRKIKVTFGQQFNGDPNSLSYDFCTKIGECYYVRSCSYPYTTEYIRKYDANGTELASVVIPRDASHTRICRNERTNHLIVFTRFTDEVTAEDGSVSNVTRMGYSIYDADLNYLGERRMDALYASVYNWLQHLNIVGGTTFISYAPTDVTQNAIHYLDENDDIVSLNFVNPSNKTFYMYGSGAFTEAEKSSTGRTNGTYYVPRMFYDLRDGKGCHTIHFVNGAKWVDIELYFTEARRNEIRVLWERYIKTQNVSQTEYDALGFFFANGSGSNSGGAAYVQNVAHLSAAGVVTKKYQAYGAVFFTDFAPDPFASLSSFPRAITGNCRLAYDANTTSRVYQLYPAGGYGQAGGAIMFTV